MTRGPPAALEGAEGCISGRDARGVRPRRQPRHTGETPTTIQLPPLSPSAPVRTQVFQPGRPVGRGLAAAYGPRVEGPDPTGTPANGGSRRADPSRNLGFRRGQRPAIPRLQQHQGPKGPRTATVANAPRRASGPSPPPKVRPAEVHSAPGNTNTKERSPRRMSGRYGPAPIGPRASFVPPGNTNTTERSPRRGGRIRN